MLHTLLYCTTLYCTALQHILLQYTTQNKPSVHLNSTVQNKRGCCDSSPHCKHLLTLHNFCFHRTQNTCCFFESMKCNISCNLNTRGLSSKIFLQKYFEYLSEFNKNQYVYDFEFVFCYWSTGSYSNILLFHHIVTLFLLKFVPREHYNVISRNRNILLFN